MHILWTYPRPHGRLAALALLLAGASQVLALVDPIIFGTIIDQFAIGRAGKSDDELVSGVLRLLALAVLVAVLSRLAKALQEYLTRLVVQKPPIRRTVMILPSGPQLESAVPKLQKITPFMWFDNQAEDAAKYYTGIFKNSEITTITHYGEAGKEIHGRPPGSVMTVGFELENQNFTALNGGPAFKFTPAISFVISCDTQEEIDYYWNKLSEGGDPVAQQCGWLADKFGASWQVVPRLLMELLTDEDRARADRAMAAILKMKKIDIEMLKRATAVIE